MLGSGAGTEVAIASVVSCVLTTSPLPREFLTLRQSLRLRGVWPASGYFYTPGKIGGMVTTAPLGHLPPSPTWPTF